MKDYDSILYDKTEVRCRGEELGETLWQGRQWSVTSDGMEKRDGTYVIDASRLSETHDDGLPGWLFHMGEKNWLDHDDFATGFFVGIALHGKSVFTRKQLETGLRHLYRYVDEAEPE